MTFECQYGFQYENAYNGGIPGFYYNLDYRWVILGRNCRTYYYFNWYDWECQIDRNEGCGYDYYGDAEWCYYGVLSDDGCRGYQDY